VFVRPQDLTCNVVGNKWWVEALEWERSAEFNAAPEEPYEVDGSSAGTVQVAEPLSFVKIADAGHLVR
jgi:serine carboxypeptidase-like clade 4